MNSNHLSYLTIGYGEESKPATIPFVIEDPDPEEKILQYTGHCNYGDVAQVNVGTVGHVDWGRRGYQPYLGFQNGGLIVAGRVIWILPDAQYAKFHKRAADWVLPSKEYVKEVVANYRFQGVK